jgi:hypothetical protein
MPSSGRQQVRWRRISRGKPFAKGGKLKCSIYPDGALRTFEPTDSIHPIVTMSSRLLHDLIVRSAQIFRVFTAFEPTIAGKSGKYTVKPVELPDFEPNGTAGLNS